MRFKNLIIVGVAACLSAALIAVGPASAQQVERGPARTDPAPVPDPNARRPITSDPNALPVLLHLAVFHFDDYDDWLPFLDSSREDNASIEKSFVGGAWNRNFIAFDGFNPQTSSQKVRIMALKPNGAVATRRDRSLAPGGTSELARIHPEPGVTDLKTFVLISREPIVAFGMVSRDRMHASTQVTQDLSYAGARQAAALTELTPRIIDCTTDFAEAPWLCMTAAEDWDRALQIGEDYFVD